MGFHTPPPALRCGGTLKGGTLHAHRAEPAFDTDLSVMTGLARMRRSRTPIITIASLGSLLMTINGKQLLGR